MRLTQIHDSLVLGCAVAGIVSVGATAFGIYLLIELPASFTRGSFRPFAYPAIALFILGASVALICALVFGRQVFEPARALRGSYSRLPVALFLAIGTVVTGMLLISIGLSRVPW